MEFHTYVDRSTGGLHGTTVAHVSGMDRVARHTLTASLLLALTACGEPATAGDAIIPLVFDSMALGHEEVRQLRSLIVFNCPTVTSDDFRRNPQDHLISER